MKNKSHQYKDSEKEKIKEIKWEMKRIEEQIKDHWKKL